ncbi:MAG TPA: hypothetical protein VK176_05570 [Phycisphaerales bacterium]|nr:hypothetical protein [Phycisphaerales bacterium]
MGTLSSMRCGVVAASLGMIAQAASGAVQVSSVNASVWGECWDRRVVPWVYRSYSETADRLPIEMGGSIRSDVVDMGSGVSMRGVASTYDAPMQYGVIFGEGGAAVVSRAAGMEVRCSVNLRSTFAMTVPAWVELQTRGLGLLELRDDRGNLARQLSGDQVVRMYLDHGFWSISGTVNIENAATGDGLFRFAIPAPGAISLLGAGAMVLATAWRRR